MSNELDEFAVPEGTKNGVRSKIVPIPDGIPGTFIEVTFDEVQPWGVDSAGFGIIVRSTEETEKTRFLNVAEFQVILKSGKPTLDKVEEYIASQTAISLVWKKAKRTGDIHLNFPPHIKFQR